MMFMKRLKVYEKMSEKKGEQEWTTERALKKFTKALCKFNVKQQIGEHRN
jgi:ribosomal protein S21